MLEEMVLVDSGAEVEITLNHDAFPETPDCPDKRTIDCVVLSEISDKSVGVLVSRDKNKSYIPMSNIAFIKIYEL